MADGPLEIANPRKRRSSRKKTSRRRGGRRRTTRRRRNPTVATTTNPRRRTRRKSNPRGFDFSVKRVQEVLAMAVPTVLGIYGSRYVVRFVLKDKDQGPLGYLANLGAGLALAGVARMAGLRAGTADLIAAGGAAATLLRVAVDQLPAQWRAGLSDRIPANSTMTVQVVPDEHGNPVEILGVGDYVSGTATPQTNIRPAAAASRAIGAAGSAGLPTWNPTTRTWITDPGLSGPAQHMAWDPRTGRWEPAMMPATRLGIPELDLRNPPSSAALMDYVQGAAYPTVY